MTNGLKKMGFGLAGILVLAACAKSEKGNTVPQTLPDETAAVNYFSQFIVKKGIPLVGPSEYLQSGPVQLAKADPAAPQAKAVYFQMSLLLEENRHYVLEYRELADADPSDNRVSGLLTVPPVLEGQWSVEDKTLVLKDKNSTVVGLGTAATNAGKDMVALVLEKDLATAGVKGLRTDLFFEVVIRGLPMDLTDLAISTPKESGLQGVLK